MDGNILKKILQLYIFMTIPIVIKIFKYLLREITIVANPWEVLWPRK